MSEQVILHLIDGAFGVLLVAVFLAGIYFINESYWRD